MMNQNTAGDGLLRSRGSFLATGVLIGMAATVVAEGKLWPDSSPPPAAVASVEFPRRVLPLEWRGGRPDLNLDPMFRKRR